MENHNCPWEKHHFPRGKSQFSMGKSPFSMEKIWKNHPFSGSSQVKAPSWAPGHCRGCHPWRGRRNTSRSCPEPHRRNSASEQKVHFFEQKCWFHKNCTRINENNLRKKSCIPTISNYGWLVVEPPLWKLWKSTGMMTFPIYGKIKTVPKHQPDRFWIRCELIFWKILFGRF